MVQGVWGDVFCEGQGRKLLLDPSVRRAFRQDWLRNCIANVMNTATLTLENSFHSTLFTQHPIHPETSTETILCKEETVYQLTMDCRHVSCSQRGPCFSFLLGTIRIKFSIPKTRKAIQGVIREM